MGVIHVIFPEDWIEFDILFDHEEVDIVANDMVIEPGLPQWPLD